jgi:poly(A) polymerase
MADLTDLNLDFLPADRRGIYLVGGTVRDVLMGLQPGDIDLAIDGDINRAATAIAEKSGGRVVDLGKKGFAVLRVASPSLTVDITPLGGPTIEADLRQRDFTINAMAYDVEAQRMVDCTGGLSDLEQKTIRMVSEAAFTKDPARLVRAYRMAATLGFSITGQTRAAIHRYAPLIDGVAGERVWAELLKLFSPPNSSSVVGDMAADALLTSIFPELEPTIGCIQNRFHQYDVFEHSLRTYAHMEALVNHAQERFAQLAPADEVADLVAHGALMKYAALLHDVGKPATRKVDADGRIRFPGHAGQGATIANVISRRLRLSRWQRETADTIIRNHIRPLFLFLATQSDTFGKRGIVRFFTHGNRLTLPILVHSMADIMAKQTVLQSRDAEFIAFCDRLMAEYGAFRNRQAIVPPLINGHDLINIFGLFPAPRFKWILSRVDERRLTGELSTRDEALEWVKAHLESRWGDDGEGIGER